MDVDPEPAWGAVEVEGVHDRYGEGTAEGEAAAVWGADYGAAEAGGWAEGAYPEGYAEGDQTGWEQPHANLPEGHEVSPDHPHDRWGGHPSDPATVQKPEGGPPAPAPASPAPPPSVGPAPPAADPTPADEPAEPEEGTSKLAKLSKRVKEQQQRIRRMEQQAVVDGQKVHDLREQLAKKDHDIAVVQEKLDFNKRELTALKTEAAEICKGAVLSWQLRAEQAERALDEAQRLLAERERQLEAMREDVTDAEAAALRATERLQGELAEARQEAEMLRAAHDKVEGQLAQATARAQERGDEVARLQAELWRTQEDLLTLQRQNQELGESGLQAKYRARQEEAERCHRRALDVMTQRMLQEVEQLKQELERAHADRDQLLRHQEDFRTFLKPATRGVSRPSPAPAAPSGSNAKDQSDGKGDVDGDVQFDYIRGIVLQFLQNSDPAFRRSVLPILATVLKLDRYELHAVYMANRQWSADPEPAAGCGTFFTSFLRPADH